MTENGLLWANFWVLEKKKVSKGKIWKGTEHVWALVFVFQLKTDVSSLRLLNITFAHTSFMFRLVVRICLIISLFTLNSPTDILISDNLFSQQSSSFPSFHFYRMARSFSLLHSLFLKKTYYAISKHEFLIQEIFSICLKFKVSVEFFFNFSRNMMYLDIMEKFLMPRLDDNGPNDMLFH